VFTAERFVKTLKYILFLYLVIFVPLQIFCFLFLMSTYIYCQYLLFRLRNNTRFTNSELAHSVSFIIPRALKSCVASEAILCKKPHCKLHSTFMQMSPACGAQSYGKRVSKVCHNCMIMQTSDMRRKEMAVTRQMDGTMFIVAPCIS